ncbi:MAG: hypothetical protein WAM39_17195 [Bryobacteraceae bacterium]
MGDSEKERNAKIIEEVSAVLAAAAVEDLTSETEPAFVYQIESRQDQPSGDDE